MSNWLSNVAARADQSGDWLSDKRQAAAAQLQERSWPTRKTEDWKYTPLKAVERLNLSESAQASPELSSIEGLSSLDLVFRNGRLDSSALSTVPEGVTITAFANVSGDQAEAALQVFGSVKPGRHLFGLVNDALVQDGVLIDVQAGVTIETPIRLAFLVGEGAEVHSRVLVRVGQGASVSVIEQYTGNQASLNTTFAEYDVAADASLEHYRFALQTGQAVSIGGSHFQLSDRSSLNSTLVGFGSDLSRVDTDIIHGGEHAQAKMNAIYLLDGKELFDLHATVEHAKPNGTTEENVRGIVADQSRAVFNGRIHIHRDAQKTQAELNNRNLLMSDKAEINTKPELEIYADDVRCAHGATVAEIDKKALYYLQSRGVSRSKAQVMLNFGFINELVDQMPNAALAEWLRPQLRDRFAQMEVK